MLLFVFNCWFTFVSDNHNYNIACSERDQLYKTSHNTATYGKHPSSKTASGNSRQNQLKGPTVRGLVDKEKFNYLGLQIMSGLLIKPCNESEYSIYLIIYIGVSFTPRFGTAVQVVSLYLIIK